MKIKPLYIVGALVVLFVVFKKKKAAPAISVAPVDFTSVQ